MTVSTREFLDADDTPESPVPEGSGEDYALVIGVNDYPKLRPLHGAIADAQAFASWLVSEDGGRVPATHVHTIVSTPDPLAPIGHEINDALEDILERAKETGGRRFYFYFSGHGCVGDRASDISLCMANWSELRRRAALSSDAWLDIVVRSGAFAEVAFFLDCCRVWAVRAVGLPPHIDFARPVERDESTRVFVAYATEFQRVAVETASDEHDGVRGIFTGTLLRGLSGYAATDDNGVTADCLKSYLEGLIQGRRQRAEVQNGLRRGARFGFASRQHEDVPVAVRRVEMTGLARPGVTHVTHSYVPVYWASARRFDNSKNAQLEFVVTLWQQSLATVATGFNPLPEITWNHPEMKLAPCRAVIVLFDDGLAGIGWSIHGGGVDIWLNGTNTWIDVSSKITVFSARLVPGGYVLRRKGIRDYALRLHAQFDLQIILSPRLDHPRIRWIPWINSGPQPPLVDFVESFDLELAPEGAVVDDGSSRVAKIIAGESFDDPALGLLAGYRLCQVDAPNPEHIEAIANRVEALLGPAPDVHALRLRAAMIRRSKLPKVTCREPPVLRDGLLAFIDASHILPEIIEPGSLLEHACVHRFVDSTVSSWPIPTESNAADTDWLAIAVAELALEHSAQGKTIDAKTIAKELRVPTLAVKAKMCEATEEYAAILQRNDDSNQRNVVDDSTTMTEEAATKAEMRSRILMRDYQGALTIVQALLALEPDNGRLRSICRTCLEKTTPTCFLVPHVIVDEDDLTSLGLDAETRHVLDSMSEELPVHDIVMSANMGPIAAMLLLHQWVQQGVIEIVRVPAQPV